MHNQPMNLIKNFSIALLFILISLHSLVDVHAIVSFFINHKLVAFLLLWCIFISIFAYIITKPNPILLLDYSCFLPDPDRRCGLEICEYFGNKSRRFSDTSADFMRQINKKSGLGNETYGPPFIFQTDYEEKQQNAIIEAEEGMLNACRSLFSKSSFELNRITHVIFGCSMFSPSPSLSSLVVNRFKLNEKVKTYNLSGMGCGGGAMALDLASRLLRREVGYVLIVVTENTSLNWYFGNDRSMLVTNCIFRVGTAAAIITNDPSVRYRAKMELLCNLRTHHGSDDASYNAAMQQEDEKGGVGVALTKDLVRVAGSALKDHISTLAPRVLPISELVNYAFNVIRTSTIFDSKEKKVNIVPNFMKAFEHICFHAGGKAVINSVGRIMKFDEEVLEPARMCLHRFGNTSSSLLFYELAYFEAKKRIKEGDRIWMLGFGTGFKACSVVWRALKDACQDSDNPWNDCIHRYPVKI